MLPSKMQPSKMQPSKTVQDSPCPAFKLFTPPQGTAAASRMCTASQANAAEAAIHLMPTVI